MKILVVGHSIAHPRQRQMWKYIAKKDNNKVILVCPQGIDGGKYDAGEVNGNFQLIVLPAYTSKNPNFWMIPGIHDIIQSYQPDVLFCMQEPWEFQSFELATLAELYRIPFGIFTWENILKTFPQPYRAIDNKVVDVADACIGGNVEAARILARKGGRNVNYLLQTGLDGNTFFPNPKIKVDHKNEPIKLLYIGRLVKSKGIGVLLEMMDELDDNYVLRIVGGRGETEVIEAITSHPKFGDTITLEDWVDYEKTPEIYNWADLVLVPSIDLSLIHI